MHFQNIHFYISKKTLHHSLYQNSLKSSKAFIVEAVVQTCSVKKVFLEISKIHRKTPVPESLF